MGLTDLTHFFSCRFGCSRTFRDYWML